MRPQPPQSLSQSGAGERLTDSGVNLTPDPMLRGMVFLYATDSASTPYKNSTKFGRLSSGDV